MRSALLYDFEHDLQNAWMVPIGYSVPESPARPTLPHSATAHVAARQPHEPWRQPPSGARREVDQPPLN